MKAGRLAPALLVLAALACRAPRPERPEGSCTHLQAVRELHGAPLCEDVWSCSRPPRGPFDRIGLRRVALCDGGTGPVVLYLPGMHMNAELPLVEPRHDLRLYLAEGGVRAWGLDYRTHAVPPDASPEELRALGGWTVDRFVDDAAWAAAFVRGADRGPLFVAGFSQGAAFAYRLASRRDSSLAGLLILDGALAPGPVAAGGGPAIDVGGSRLPFAERQRLLDQVIADAKGPSPVPGFPTAGAALAHILSTAPSFGGEGGLAAGTRVSEIPVLATLLRSYDRWWPRAALDGPTPRVPKPPLPVLAFASTNMGPAWVDRVRATARAYGGPEAEVRELAGYGHLDVLVARRATQEVFQPALAWLDRLAGR